VRKKHCSSKCLLKPVSPMMHLGNMPDTRKFLMFTALSISYATDGIVAKKDTVARILLFLKEKVHKLYMRQLTLDPTAWRIKDFFCELCD
jgi:hypothetical protein